MKNTQNIIKINIKSKIKENIWVGMMDWNGLKIGQ